MHPEPHLRLYKTKNEVFQGYIHNCAPPTLAQSLLTSLLISSAPIRYCIWCPSSSSGGSRQCQRVDFQQLSRIIPPHRPPSPLRNLQRYPIIPKTSSLAIGSYQATIPPLHSTSPIYSYHQPHHTTAFFLHLSNPQTHRYNDTQPPAPHIPPNRTHGT